MVLHSLSVADCNVYLIILLVNEVRDMLYVTYFDVVSLRISLFNVLYHCMLSEGNITYTEMLNSNFRNACRGVGETEYHYDKCNIYGANECK